MFFFRKEQGVSNERVQAHTGFKRAAQKMVDNTDKELPFLEICNILFFNIPKIQKC